MTRTTPRLRRILHLSQITLTEARTFIVFSQIRMQYIAPSGYLKR
jgi:hypothetical protein